MKWLTKQPGNQRGELALPVPLVSMTGRLALTLGLIRIRQKLKKTRLATFLGLRRLYAAIARVNCHHEYQLRLRIMSEDIVDPCVRHALKDLLDPTGHFSICKFDEICKLLNVIPPPGHRDRLSLMHCNKYRDMEIDLRQEVGRLIYESINTAGFDIEIQRERLLGRDNVKSITGDTL